MIIIDVTSAFFTAQQFAGYLFTSEKTRLSGLRAHAACFELVRFAPITFTGTMGGALLASSSSTPHSLACSGSFVSLHKVLLPRMYLIQAQA